MCGACGRTVVSDPVLGPVRTRRDLLVVAQLVNAITEGLPGMPAVRATGDGWEVLGRTGTSTACATVRQLWAELSGRARTPEAASSLTARILRGLPAASALPDRVLREGLASIDG